MNPGAPSRTWIVSLSALLGVACALALLPRARSTAAAQARLALGQRPEWLRAAHGGPAPRIRRAVTTAPNDAELAIAVTFLEGVAPSHPTTDGITEPVPSQRETDLLLSHLAAVADRFPQSAGVRAHILRHSLREAGLIWRKDQPGLQASPRAWAADTTLVRRRQEALRRFLTAAAEGQRLEPANGFFDSMHAVAAFSTGSESEALRDLHAAAAKPQWDDHAADEARAQWKLLRRSYGEHGALQTSSSAYDILFPHFAALREAARSAVRQAELRASAGDHAAAITIRSDVMRLGLRVEADHPTLIGKLVGRAVFELGAAPPGDRQPRTATTSPVPRDVARRKRDRRERCAAYFTAHGAAGQAAWVRDEGERLDARYARIQQALTQTTVAGLATRYNRLLAWWAIGLIIWKQILALTVLWAAVSLAARVRSSEGRGPLRASGKAWLMVGLTLLLGPYYLVSRLPWSPLLLGSLVVGIVLTGMLALAVSAGQRRAVALAETPERHGSEAWPLWRPILVALVGILPTVAGLVWAASLLSASGWHWVIEQGAWAEQVSGFLRTGQMSQELGSGLLALGLVPTGIILFLLLCRVAALGQPLLPGLSRGLRRVVPIALAMLTLLYITVLAPTITADRAVEYQVQQSLTDEAQYLQGTR